MSVESRAAVILDPARSAPLALTTHLAHLAHLETVTPVTHEDHETPAILDHLVPIARVQRVPRDVMLPGADRIDRHGLATARRPR
jgi:hypothetical protein